MCKVSNSVFWLMASAVLGLSVSAVWCARAAGGEVSNVILSEDFSSGKIDSLRQVGRQGCFPARSRAGRTSMILRRCGQGWQMGLQARQRAMK